MLPLISYRYIADEAFCLHGCRAGMLGIQITPGYSFRAQLWDLVNLREAAQMQVSQMPRVI